VAEQFRVLPPLLASVLLEVFQSSNLCQVDFQGMTRETKPIRQRRVSEQEPMPAAGIDDAG